MSNTISERLDKLETLMDSITEGEWVEVSTISNNPSRFIEAIKFLIDFRKKPYEFNNNSYTKVRRIEYE
jgi:hypothetical protein